MIKKALLAAAVAAASFMGSAASAVTFDITGGGYTLGSGFGCPSSQQNNQLCVVANYTLGNPAAFNLNNAGDETVLTFGTFRLQDDDANLQGGESDNLEVTAYLDFTDPFVGQASRLATTGTVSGQFSDVDADLWITFDPLVVNFGNGGQFTVRFDSMFFAANPQTVTQNVRITLDALSREVPQVPEPGMLGLLGLGVLGVAAGRRRKAA